MTSTGHGAPSKYPITQRRTWHYADGTTSNGIDIQGKRSRIFIPRHRLLDIANDLADAYEQQEDQ